MLLAPILFAAAASAATLQPIDRRPLDTSCGEGVISVAWSSDDELLLASLSGVTRYSLAKRTCSPLISNEPYPNGLRSAFGVASDGRSAVAFGLPMNQHAVRLSDHSRLFARRDPDYTVSDLAVAGDRLYILGFPTFDTSRRLPSPIVWRGELTSDWSNLVPVHDLHSNEEVDIFRDSFVLEAGALDVEPDGTLDVITAAQPGVFRYRADGTPLPPLGRDLTDLVFKNMPELFRLYRKDEEGRYRNGFNRQPKIDDLIVTPDGPAILVRIAAGDMVHWELWYPNEHTVSRKIELGFQRPGPFGIMHCSARGDRLACIADQPPDATAKRGAATLLLFKLPRAPAHVIKTNRNGQAEALEDVPATIASDETIWRWSASCAPSTTAQCDGGRWIEIHTDAHTSLRWGTAEMLRAIPDALLPEGETDAAGHATLRIPSAGTVFVRAAGPEHASRWTKLADDRRTGLATSAAVPVRIRIADDAGTPVRNATLRISPVDLASDCTPYRAFAPSGTAEIPPIPATAAHVVDASSPALLPARVVAAVGDLPAAISLHRGADVRGRVTAGRKPVAGATINATFAVHGELTERKTSTSPNGSFRIAGLPAGKIELAVTAPRYRAITTAFDLEANDDHALSIALEQGSRLVVHVASQDGVPIANATVRADGTPEEARTDAGGMAELRDAPAAGEIDVEAEEFLPARRPFRGESVEAVLTRAAAVTFRAVRRHEHSAVRAGTVAVRMNGNERLLSLDSTGTTRVTGLRAGSLMLEIRGSGSLPLPVPELAIAAGEQRDLGEIELDDGLTARGVIVDASTHERLADAHVRMLRPNAFAATHSLLMGDWIDSTTDTDGQFTIAGLSNGSWTVIIEAAGHTREVRSISIDHDTDFGVVPLASARTLIVHCVPSARCGDEAHLLVAGPQAEWAAVTSPLNDGTAILTPVGSGSYLLRLLSERGIVFQHDVAISDASGVTEMTIRVPSVTVDGRVLVHGTSSGDGTVRFRRTPERLVTVAQRTPSGTPFVHNLGSFAADLTAPVHDGVFILNDVTAGTYEAAFDDSAAQTVIIPEGVDRVPVTLTIGAGDLFGTVLRSGGSPVERAAITIVRNGRTVATTATDAHGHFVVSGVGDGTIGIRASAQDGFASADMTLGDDARHVVLVLAK